MKVTHGDLRTGLGIEKTGKLTHFLSCIEPISQFLLKIDFFIRLIKLY